MFCVVLLTCDVVLLCSSFQTQEVAVVEEVMRMMLEIFNSCLSSSLHHNPNLVYAMLYQRSLFTQLLSHSTFQDIVSNIDMVTNTTTSSLHHNPNLIYAMLYLRSLFTQLLSHSTFQDIVSNIDMVTTVQILLILLLAHFITILTSSTQCSISDHSLRSYSHTAPSRTLSLTLTW